MLCGLAHVVGDIQTLLDITLTIRLFTRLGTCVNKGRENLKIIVLN
jgi:hypothetical protein